MNWYRDLYVGNTFQKKKKIIKKMTEEGKQVPGLYLILIRTDDKRNQMELVPQLFLSRTVKDESKILIVGIAFGKEEAMEILVRMTEKVYHETGDVNLREFFLDHSRQFRLKSKR